MFVAEGGFDAVVGWSVHFGLLSIIVLMIIPQTKPMINITVEHSTPIETALAIDIGSLMKFKLSTHNKKVEVTASGVTSTSLNAVQVSYLVSSVVHSDA